MNLNDKKKTVQPTTLTKSQVRQLLSIQRKDKGLTGAQALVELYVVIACTFMLWSLCS